MSTVRAFLIVVFLLLFPSGLAQADPNGGVVVGGQAQISRDGSTTTVNQVTDRAIINWQSMNVDAHELLRFNQPSSSSWVLNRILDGNPTSILGQLSANGRVFISNPRGVIFGAGSSVDVGSLLATTFDIGDDDFMAGRLTFRQPGGIDPASVINQGELRVADNGFVMLVAPGVRNEGLIVARLGTVVLGAGEQLTLDFQGDGLMTYAVTGEAAQQLLGPDGQPLPAASSNAGTIDAAGGHVLLTGRAAAGVLSAVVNNTGVIVATSLVNRGGRIVLEGGAGGTVENHGVLDVSAGEPGAQPGEVTLSGRFAGNFGTILARGARGADGGLVQLLSTTHTLTSTTSSIDVSGGEDSSGGTVLLRSDNRSTFAGTVLARGGALAGDGGFVDVSSPGQVELYGVVDATAANGQAGTLLIDPKFLVVAAVGVPYDGTNNTFSNNAAGTTVITAASINAQAADVLLQANTDVTLSLGADIALGADLDLTIQAGRSVIINNSITTSGTGTVTIRANDPTLDGTNRDAGAATITMGAGASITTADSNITLVVDPAGLQGGDILLRTLDAGTANVTIRGAGGSVLDAAGGAGAANITAGGADIRITSGTGTIGAAGTPLRTSIANFTAITEDGGIFVTEADGLLVNQVLAKQGGNTPVVSGDQVLTGGVAGTHDVAITATLGNIIMNTLTAPDRATITALGGDILDGNGGTTNVLARDVNLVASGDIADPLLALGVTSDSVNATTTDGGISIALGIGGQVGTTGITAGGATGAVFISNATGDVLLGTLTAAGTVTVDNTAGAIRDDNGAAVNVTANGFTATAGTGIGTGADPLDVSVANLSVTSTSNSAITVANAVAATTLSATTADGDVTITGASALTFATATNRLDASGATSITFGNTTGGVLLGLVDATAAGTVRVTAAGSLTDDDAAVDLVADGATLTASTFIGAAGAELETDVASLAATANAGGVYVREQSGVSLTAIAKGAGSDVDVQAATGDLTLVSVAAPDAVTVVATSGDILAASANNVLTATSASLTATAGDIGALAPGFAITMTVNSLTSVTAAGTVAIFNNGPLNAAAVSAGGDLSLGTSGDLTLSSPLSAPGRTIELIATGALIDANAAPGADVTASTVILSGRSIGSATDALETSAGTLTANASAGGIWLTDVSAGPVTLDATALGRGADITVGVAGDLVLGLVSAAGDDVTLTAGGAISDGNDTTAPDVFNLNVSANTLTITAGSGIGAATPPLVPGELETEVNTLTATGGTGGVFVVNLVPLVVTAGTITGGSGTIRASSITIEDLGAAAVVVPAGNSLLLQALSGDIVFLDETDTIQTTGTGTITVAATGPGAVAILGNLVTAGGDITVTADSHITLGLLDAGSGDVSVTSNNGLLLDGNGAALNIVGANVTLDSDAPTLREAELGTIQAIADASAAEAQANSTDTTADAFLAAAAVTQAARLNAAAALAAADADVAAKEATYNSLDATAEALAISAQAASAAALVAEGVATAAGLVSGPAQAIPLTGDGGAETVESIAEAVAYALEIAATALGFAEIFASGDAEDALVELISATATQAAAAAALTQATASDNAMNEAVSITQAAAYASSYLALRQAKVADQAIAAEDRLLAAGGLNDSLEIAPSGVLNATSNDSSLLLNVAGPVTVGTVSATGAGASVIINTTSAGDMTIGGAITATSQVRLSVLDGAVLQGAGGSITAQELVIRSTAGAGVGAGGALQTTVGRLAATTGAGGLLIDDTSALEVGVVDGLSGLTAGGDVVVSTLGDLTLARRIDAAGQTVTLTSGGAIIDANATGSDIVAANLAASAASGIGAADPLETQVLALELGATTGDIRLVNTAATTTVGGVSAGLGGVTTGSAGTIQLTTSGALTATGALEPIATAVGGTIALTAGGTITLTNGAVSTGTTGTTTITATSGNIVGAAGTENVQTGTLTLRASGAYGEVGSAGVPLVIEADQVTIVTGAAGVQGGLIHVADTGGGLAVAGATTNGLDVPSITIRAASPLTILGDVTAGGPISLVAGNSGGAGDDLRVSSGVTVRSTGGAVTLTAGDNVFVEANALVSAASLLTITANAEAGGGDLVTGAVTLDGPVSGAGVTITGGGLSHTSTITSTGPVSIATASDASSPIDGLRLGSIVATGQTVTLSATGTTPLAAILDNNGGSSNVEAASLSLLGAAGVGTTAGAGALETTVGNLAADGGTGGVFVSNTGDLSLTPVGLLATLTASGGGIGVTTAGDLSITDGFVQGAGLSVDLTALGGTITELAPGGAADVVGAVVNLTATGLGGAIGTALEALEVDAGTLNAATGGGSIFLVDTAGGVAVGLLTTGGALGSQIDLRSAGDITEAGVPDATADFVADLLTLTVTGAAPSVGTVAQPLELDVNTLSVTALGAGGVFLTEVTGDLAVDLVTTGAGTGSVALRTLSGSLLESATPDAGADIVAGTISLTVAGGASTVGTVAEALDVDATTLDVTTVGGSVYLADTAGGVGVGLITTGGAQGEVRLTAAGGSITDAAGDAAADVVALRVDLATTTGGATIGAVGADLEVDATTLDASTLGGDIVVTDTAGGVGVDLVTTGGAAGTVTLTAVGGQLGESASSDGAADVVGLTVNLITTSSGDSIGTSAEVLEVDAVTLNVTTNAGDVFLTDMANGVGLGLVTTGGAGDVSLTAVLGSITEAAVADGAADLVGDLVTLTTTGAGNTVGTAAQPLELDAVTLNVTTDGGDIALADTAGGVRVGLVTTGGLAGDVTLSTVGGSLLEALAADAAADVVGVTVSLGATGGTIGTTLEALEVAAGVLNATTSGDDIVVQDVAGGLAVGLVTTGGVSGDVVLGSIDGSLVAVSPGDLTADVVGASITLTTTDLGDTIGAPGQTLDIDAVTLDASTNGGSIFLDDVAGGVAVGLVTTGGTLGDVRLTVRGGDLLEAAAPDAAADLVGVTIDLVVTSAGRTIGASGQALELDATTLNATTAGGDVFLQDTAGGVGVGLATTGGAGDVTLASSGGSITDASGDATADVVGDLVSLSATRAGDTLGTGLDALELDAATLDASTGGGDMFLRDVAGGVAVGLVTTGGAGDVNLTATGGSITEAAATDAAADIVGDVLNLVATGAGQTVGTTAEALEVDAVTLNVTTSGGDIVLTDTAGGVGAGLVTTGGAAGRVTLTSLGGDLLEAAVSDGAADIVGLTIDLIATGPGDTVGAASQTLELDAGTLNVTTSDGDVFLQDVAGGVALGLVTTGGAVGDVTLTVTGGSIADAGDDAGTDVVGDVVSLVTTGAGNGVGTAGARLEIDAVTLNVTTSGGDIVLTDAAGGVSVGLVTTGGATGDVDLVVTGGDLAEAAVADGAADLVGVAITLTVTGAGDSIGAASETLELDAVTLDATTNGGDVFLHDTAGGVAVGLVTTGGAGDVSLTVTGGDLLEAGAGDSAADIVGDAVNLVATSGSATLGAAAQTLELDATTLDATTVGGDMFLEDVAGGLRVGLVTTGGATGDVTLTVTGGSLEEAALADASADIVGATLNLVSAGTVGTLGETLEVDADVLNVTTSGGDVFLQDTVGGVGVGLVTTGGAGDVTLTSSGGSITDAQAGAAADVVGDVVNLVTTGASDAIGAAADVLELDAVTLNVTTNGGDVFLRDVAGGVAVGLVTTGGAGDVSLTATGGSITEAAATDAAADIVGDVLNLVATGAGQTVGTAAEALEVDAVTLNVTTSGGDIVLTDTAGGVGAGLVTTGGAAGRVTLTSLGGDLTEAALSDAAADIVGLTIDLVATGSGDTVGTAAETLEVDAGTLNVTTNDGDVFLEDVAGGVALGLVTTGGAVGDVTLTATGGSMTDAGDDAGTDVVGDVLSLRTSGGAGATVGTLTGTLEVDAVTLNVATEGADVVVHDTAGGVGVGLVTTGGVTGDVFLAVTGGDLTEAAATDPFADLVGVGVTLTVTDAGDTIGTASETLELDAVTLDATTNGGDMFLHDTAGGLALGLVTTGGLAGNVTLTVTGGDLTEAAAADAAADLVGVSVDLRTTDDGASIGARDEALELDATTLDAATSGGDMYLVDTAGGVAVGLVTTGGAAGAVELTALLGSITEAAATDADADVVAPTMNLVVTGPGNTIGTSTETLEVDADLLDLTTEDGDVFLQDTDGGVALGLLDAGAGTITLAAATITDGTQTSLVAGGAVLRATDGIGAAANPLDTDLDLLEASSDLGGVFVSDAGSFAVGGLTGLVGVQAPGDVSLTAQGALGVNEDVLSAAGGDVTVTSLAGDLTIAARVAATGGSGDVTLTAAGQVTQSGQVSAVGLGGVSITSRLGGIRMLPGARTTVALGDVRLSAADDVIVTVIETVTTAPIGGRVFIDTFGRILPGDVTTRLSSEIYAREVYMVTSTRQRLSDLRHLFDANTPRLVFLNGRLVMGSVAPEYLEAVGPVVQLQHQVESDLLYLLPSPADVADEDDDDDDLVRDGRPIAPLTALPKVADTTEGPGDTTQPPAPGSDEDDERKR